MSSFPNLLAPFALGRCTLRSRIVLTGHGTGMATGFKPNQQMVDYYRARARGGVGLIMLGSQQVHPTSPGITNLLCNFDDGIIPGLAAVARAVHVEGVSIFGYLSHMGGASSARPRALWSASPMYEQKYGEVAHDMTIEEMEELVAAYVAAALRNLEAGLDGIEVHCGHGLLLNQFLSPLTNRRQDEYGGSVEDRARFPCRVLQAVREAIGEDVPLGVRVSGDELVEGGLNVEAMRAVVPLLVAAGRLDYVDVSAGNDGDLVSNMLHEPPMGLPPAPYAHLARALKEVLEVPVIHGTRIHTAELAEQVLARGDADLVGMCRALIADPELPAKAREGRLEEIIPCVGCEQACLGRLHRGMHISCVGNPVTGREGSFGRLPRMADKRFVIVVGGGLAGMEAALVSARRGHRVRLIERTSRLGGRILLAACAPGREEWLRLVGHRKRALKAAGVELSLDEEVEPATLAGAGADAIVVATGASPCLPDLPGAKLAHVVTAEAVLANDAAPRRRVVVADLLDRQPGPTVACYLAERGHEVEIVTASLHVGQKLEVQTLAHLYRQMHDLGVRMRAQARLVSIGEDHVVLREPFSGRQCVRGDIDTVVIAGPPAAEDSLARALRGKVPELHVIGDAYAPRDVEAAVLEGHNLGRTI